MNAREIIDGLPDEALVPVGFVRTLLAESAVEQSDPIADLAVEEIARALGRKPSTIRGWCANGRLEAYRLNGREWRVTPSALRAYRDRQRVSGDRPTSSSGPGGEVDLRAWRKVREGAGSQPRAGPDQKGSSRVDPSARGDLPFP